MKPLLFLLIFGIAAAQVEDHAHHAASPVDDGQFIVTINPEARVSVVLGAPLPAPSPCGTAQELKVNVVNDGFVTAPLQAAVIGDGARYVSLHMDGAKLSGEAKDTRTLRLIPHGPELVDVTMAFSIDNNLGDLGGRDRVHFLMRCMKNEMQPK